MMFFCFLAFVFNGTFCAEFNESAAESLDTGKKTEVLVCHIAPFYGPVSRCFWAADQHVGDGGNLQRFLQNFVDAGTLQMDLMKGMGPVAFINENFEQAVLRGCLRWNLEQRNGVKRMGTSILLTADDVSALPPLAWRVFKSESGTFDPPKRMLISLDFPGGALAGVPRTEMACVLQGLPEWTCASCAQRANTSENE